MIQLPDDVRSLLSQYKFKLSNDSTNNDINCVICQNLITEPFKSSCACYFCHKCVVNYLKDGDKICCGKTDLCYKNVLSIGHNLVKTEQLNTAILNAYVMCPNQLCSYRAKLTVMREHLRLCNNQPAACPYYSIGCEVQINSSESMLSHQQNNALKHTELLIEWIYNLKNELDSNKFEIETLKKECKDNKNKLAQMEEVARTKDMRIWKLEEEVKLKQIQMEHISKDIVNHINEIDQLKKTSTGQEEKIAALENDIKNKDRNECDMTTAINGDTMSRINCLEMRVRELDIGTNMKVAVGITSFCVENFEMMNVPNEGIVSPYFYTHTNGYKIRLQLYPGGYGGAAGSHMSVYIVIGHGEYDELLPWPCKHSIKVSIINQLNGDTHHSDTIEYIHAEDQCRHSFYKPNDTNNAAYGFPKFISHTELQDTAGLVLNDSLLLRCVVNSPI